MRSDTSMPDPDDLYSEAETIARREAALKRMLSTPHVANPKRRAAESRPGKLGRKMLKRAFSPYAS